MEKTEKTMLELEIDYNQRAWEWSRLTESGTKLVPKFGPGFTGTVFCYLLIMDWVCQYAVQINFYLFSIIEGVLYLNLVSLSVL